jgi:LytS/YehU family sensor histidine kinase
MGLILLLAQPFDQALKVVTAMALPMIAADALGVAAFAFMLKKIRAGA